MDRVTFSSHGATLVGNLYAPENARGPARVVVLLGPMTFVKEHALTEYTCCLEAQGFSSWRSIRAIEARAAASRATTIARSRKWPMYARPSTTCWHERT